MMETTIIIYPVKGFTLIRKGFSSADVLWSNLKKKKKVTSCYYTYQDKYTRLSKYHVIFKMV